MITVLVLLVIPVGSLAVLPEHAKQIAALSQRLDRLTDEVNKERSQKQLQYNSLAGQIVSLKHELADERTLRRSLNDKLASLQEAEKLDHGIENVASHEVITQTEAIKQIQRNISELYDKYAKLEKDADFKLWGNQSDSKDFNKISYNFAGRFEALSKGFRTLKENKKTISERIGKLENNMNVISNNMREYQTKTGGNEKILDGLNKDIKRLFVSILELDTKLDRVQQTTPSSSSSSLTTVLPGKFTGSGAKLAAILKQGMRVVRGQDWQWGNQDGNPPGPGTVLKIRDDRWVSVKWDAGEENNYRMHDGKYDLALYTPEGSKLAQILKPGMRVVRGVDWKWGDQDGIPPGPGKVLQVNDNGWVRVKWDAGQENNYRMHQGVYDLALYTE